MLEPITWPNLVTQVAALIGQHPTIDGIFTINDGMALDVIRILRRQGYRIPEDIQVIGFDGQRINDGADYLVSTIAQPANATPKNAAACFIAVIEGQTVPQRTVLPVHFEDGGTTKPRQIDLK